MVNNQVVNISFKIPKLQLIVICFLINFCSCQSLNAFSSIVCCCCTLLPQYFNNRIQSGLQLPKKLYLFWKTDCQSGSMMFVEKVCKICLRMYLGSHSNIQIDTYIFYSEPISWLEVSILNKHFHERHKR